MTGALGLVGVAVLSTSFVIRRSDRAVVSEARSGFRERSLERRWSGAWHSPVLWRELRTRGLVVRLPWPWLAVGLLVLVQLGLEGLVLSIRAEGLVTDDVEILASLFAGLALFLAYVFVLFDASRAFSADRRCGAFELVATSPFPPRRIVRDKVLAATAWPALLAIPAGIRFLAVYAVDRFDVTSLGVAALCVGVVWAALAQLGVACSLVFRRDVAAILAAVATLMAIGYVVGELSSGGDWIEDLALLLVIPFYFFDSYPTMNLLDEVGPGALVSVVAATLGLHVLAAGPLFRRARAAGKLGT